MVAGYFTQFLLLAWKNVLLQRRKLCVTIFEIVLPLAFPILLRIIRNLTDTKPTLQEATLYKEEPVVNSNFYDTQILYSPNTTLIHGILENASLLIKGNIWQISFTGTPSPQRSSKELKRPLRMSFSLNDFFVLIILFWLSDLFFSSMDCHLSVRLNFVASLWPRRWPY